MGTRQAAGAAEPDDACGLCGHPFGPHVLVPFADPLDGGLIFCQDLTGCDCVATWSVQGRPRAQMPPPHVIAEWREALLESRGAL